MELITLFVLLLGLVIGALVGALVAGSRLRADATARVDAVVSDLRVAEAEAAALSATLDTERDSARQRIDDLRVEQQRLAEQFRALSSKALADNAQAFLQLADERFKAAQVAAAGELEQRKQAVEHLVAPLTESLGKVAEQINVVEQARTSAYAELRQQVEGMGKASEQLRLETSQLVTALRAPQIRGRWGELQLRRVVESAGMVEHCDFVEQESVTTPDGTLRPDLVVQLAGGKQIVVDSKVSFAGYLEAMEARDDTTRTARLTAHARHLKTHIDDLGGKRYWEHFDPTPEFVVMFVPAEVFLNAALERDPTLLEYAFERNVVIATPATLVALLRTVAYTWRQEALAKNAQQVLNLGRDLHGRLSTMGNHLSKLGRQLTGAVKSYNDTVSSMESRVLVTARKMADLKVVESDLEAPAQIELVAREIQAPELVASATDSLIAFDEIETDARYGVTAAREPQQPTAIRQSGRP